MTTKRLSISLQYSCWSVLLIALGHLALITDWWLGNWCLGVWVPVRFKPGTGDNTDHYTHPFSSAYTTTNRINRAVPVRFRATDQQWLLFTPLPKLGHSSACDVSWPREWHVAGVHGLAQRYWQPPSHHLSAWYNNQYEVAMSPKIFVDRTN